MKPVRQLETQCSHAEFLRNLPAAFDYRPFELTDNQVIVHDRNRAINITIHDEPIRTLGSLKLPMEKLKFVFDGYSEDEADAIMKSYRQHTLRAGGG